jgi:pyrroloquinoline quinone (PQQ) biosynthesis protein C
MEHFKSPFSTSDFSSERARENQRFFEEALARAQSHAFYSHPFLTSARKIVASRDITAIVLTSFYKIVSPFTGLLCSLGGRSPNLKMRFALMDNIYEEMGCGDFDSAHPSLFLRMLASIGVSAEAAEASPTLPSIRRINEHLAKVVADEPFAVACALLASAEATIPPSFPALASLARSAFPEVDMQFFDRHGPRDEGHSDDAAVLFALSAEPSHFPLVEACIKRDLDCRVELFDEWLWALTAGSTRTRSTLSQPPPRSARPVAERHSAPPL